MPTYVALDPYTGAELARFYGADRGEAHFAAFLERALGTDHGVGRPTGAELWRRIFTLQDEVTRLRSSRSSEAHEGANGKR